MGRREGFIFVSSPGSVTPHHMDPEHNFLLQITRTEAGPPVRRRGPRAPHRARAGEVSTLAANRNPGLPPTRTSRRPKSSRSRTATASTFPVTWPHWSRTARRSLRHGRSASRSGQYRPIAVRCSIASTSVCVGRDPPAAGGPLGAGRTAPSIRPSGPWPARIAGSEAERGRRANYQ